MPTEKKIAQVKELEEQLRRATIAIAAEFRSVNVNQMMEARRKFREQGVEYFVVKNTLAAMAGNNVGKPVSAILKGPTGLLLGYGDVVAPAKVITEYIRASKINLVINGAVLDGQVLTSADVQNLANTPPKPVLIGKALGALLSPVYGLAYALNFHISGLARVLEARRKQLESAGSPGSAAGAEHAESATAG